MSDPLAELSIYAAQDPTAAWTFTSSVDMRTGIWNTATAGEHYRRVSIIVTPSATSPTTYQLKMQSSEDDTTWADEVMVIEVLAGSGVARCSILNLEDEDGSVLADRGVVLHFKRASRRYMRWALRKTGGAGTDRLQVSRALAKE